MRLLAVTALTVTGCFGTTGNEALVGAAIETVGFIADTVANSSRPDPPEEPADPPPSSIRDVWRGPALDCTAGRTIHLRCVTAAGGRLCFWETDEGVPYDCPDEQCKTLPSDLAAWCYGNG
jgi:hypothetical protein